MKVLAFGSRGLRDERLVRAVIHGLFHTRPGGEGFHLICGAEPKLDDTAFEGGTDALAWKVAGELDWCQRRAYPVAWRTHDPLWCQGTVCTQRNPRESWWCKTAYRGRNQQILDVEHTEDQPIDLWVRFTGTKRSPNGDDMARRLKLARIAGFEVHAVPAIDDERAAGAQEPVPGLGAYEQAPLLRLEIKPGTVPEGEPPLDRLGRHRPVWAPDAK